MFDIFELMNFGGEFEADGQKWIRLKNLPWGERLVLAAKASDTLPCPVYLVQMPPTDTSRPPAETPPKQNK
jgi:hypothetical protein